MEALAPQKKFAITSYTPPYEPAQRPKPRFKIIQDYDSYIPYTYGNSHKLFITDAAMRQIFNHIGWGERTKHNSVEQGGILLGHVFRDENKRLTYGIVETAVAASSARATSSHLEMTHETWKQMLDSVDDILNQNPPKLLQVIGWYHTHPNDLSVYMSGTDQATQRRLFSHDWQFAIVMNPHKQIWKAFYGAEANECRGFVIEGEQDSESNNSSEKLPDDVKRLEQNSTAGAKRNTKVFIRWINSIRLKKSLSRLWRSVKMFFRKRQRDYKFTGNQAQLSPTQNGRYAKTPINENKINFFIWLYGFILVLILLLQIANLWL